MTLRAHDLVPAVVGQPELDPDVQEMRQQLRAAARRRVDRHRLVHGDGLQGAAAPSTPGGPWRCSSTAPIPEDEVVVPFFGRPTPFLRSPALLARFCGCEILPGFFLRNPDGSYFNVWGEPLSADPTLSPDDDAVRIMARVACGSRGRRPRATRRSGSTSTGSGTPSRS